MNLLSATYAAVASARRHSYERHGERRKRLARPVISIGNLSVGGTGKTPAVAHVARLLLAAGEHPAILTRGYARSEPSRDVVVVADGVRICADLARAGDEPLMLARALPGVAVFVGADRYASGLLAEGQFGCTVHILDDGFQHVQLARDADIVLMRAEDFDDRVLPVGRLRESIHALSAADAIVLVGQRGYADFAGRSFGSGDTSSGAAQRRFTAVPRIVTDRLSAGGAVFAVAGIARPRRFFEALVEAGVRVAGDMTFPDHHRFARGDLDRVVRAARQSGAERVATTEKDYVRLLPLRPFPMPIVPVPLELAIEPAAEFREWLFGRAGLTRAAERS